MGGIKAHIVTKEGNPLRIDNEGAAYVIVHPHPPVDEKVHALPFRQYFTDPKAGSTDMAVDGSTTAKDFLIQASPDYDIYIKYISAEIGDGGTPALNKFGALSALSNGLIWFWFTQEDGAYILHEGIKTNKEFIRIGTDTAAIGTGIDAYLADVSGGGTEKSYLPSIDISESYGLPWGLRLRKGTTDAVGFRVKDNLTGLTTFNIVGTGIRM